MGSARHDSAGGHGAKLPRGSHGLPPEFVTHSQRDRLFAGMARVMARQGYAATTVDQIAAESGVSRKALYAHFSGKEDVLLQAQRAVVRRIAAGAGPAIDEQDDRRAALRALLDWALELFGREPALANLILVEGGAATPASRQLQYELLGGLRASIERAAESSDHPLSPLAIDGMVGGLSYVVARAAEEGDAARLPELRPQLMAWIVLLLDGPEAARRELSGNP